MTKLASIEPVSHLFASFAKPATVYPVQSIRTNRVLVNCGRLVNCVAVTHLRMSLFLLPQLCRVSQPLRCPPHRHSGSRRTTMNSVPRFSPVTPLPRQNSFSFHTHRPSVKHFHRPPFFPQRAATSGMTPSARSSPHGARSPSARCDPHRPPRVPPARSGDCVVPPARNFHGRAPPCSYRGFYPASISEAGLNWKTSRHLAPKFFERLVEKWPFGGGFP